MAFRPNTFFPFLLANSSQRLSKRQFVAVRIEHVEVAFAPGRVAGGAGSQNRPFIKIRSKDQFLPSDGLTGPDAGHTIR
jgi:hypothetical protein